jgi:flagellar basal-body rod modification protein FlgD
MNVTNVFGQELAPGFLTSDKGSGSTAELGRDMFLELLIAQLENQDPLAPTENAEFTAQLAQFSSLEQMEAMQTKLAALVAAQETANSIQTAGLIGKEVKAQSNTVQLHQGEAPDLRYTLAADSAKVTISIFNDAGNLVRTIELADQQAGEQVVSWSGIDAQGNSLPDGEYIFMVAAEDSTGTPVFAQTFVQGRVEGVEYQADQPFLLIGGNRVDPGALISIQEG